MLEINTLLEAQLEFESAWGETVFRTIKEEMEILKESEDKEEKQNKLKDNLTKFKKSSLETLKKLKIKVLEFFHKVKNFLVTKFKALKVKILEVCKKLKGRAKAIGSKNKVEIAKVDASLHYLLAVISNVKAFKGCKSNEEINAKKEKLMNVIDSAMNVSDKTMKVTADEMTISKIEKTITNIEKCYEDITKQQGVFESQLAEVATNSKNGEGKEATVSKEALSAMLSVIQKALTGTSNCLSAAKSNLSKVKNAITSGNAKKEK